MAMSREERRLRNKARRASLPEEERRRIYREQSARYRAEKPEIVKAANKRWKDKNPGSVKAEHVWRRYGLSMPEYEELISKPCALCGDPSRCVDHCHETGRVRAGLCYRCNMGLGYFGDDPERLRAAADYLASFTLSDVA
jgi:hypothetical protein